MSYPAADVETAVEDKVVVEDEVVDEVVVGIHLYTYVSRNPKEGSRPRLRPALVIFLLFSSLNAPAAPD